MSPNGIQQDEVVAARRDAEQAGEELHDPRALDDRAQPLAAHRIVLAHLGSLQQFAAAGFDLRAIEQAAHEEIAVRFEPVAEIVGRGGLAQPSEVFESASASGGP
jgi:hypothetical protein